MKISPFKIGLVLVIVGMIWISIIFADTEKSFDGIVLKQSSSFEIKSQFTGTDIGYYKVYMPEFTGEEIFVQILDVKDNVIQEQVIQTKMSVGYFDYEKNGKYSMRIVNISENSVNLQAELGETNSQNMIPAGVILVVGALIIIISSYLKLKNYKIAQPDENIS